MTKYSFLTNTLLSAMAGAVLTVFAAGANAAPFFTGLGDLAGGSFYSEANSISADGSVVVGWSHSASGNEGFRWTQDGGMVGLGGGPAYDTSADGSVVVGHSVAGEAFRWTEGGGMVGLGILGDFPYGTSADGSVVVGRGHVTSASEAFRWTQDGGMVGLGDLTHRSGTRFAFSEAFATSADGSVVVGRASSPSDQAFRWTQDGGMVGLGNLGGTSYSAAFDTSADGSVVVGRSYSVGIEAFRWTQGGGMVGLGDLAGGTFFSEANSVSADGSVVIGRSTSARGDEAFIWDMTNGMRLLEDVLVGDFGLDLTGWRLIDARGISADNLLVTGFGINPDGNGEAFIAGIQQDPVAEVKAPGAIALLGLGLAGLGWVQRRKPHQRH